MYDAHIDTHSYMWPNTATYLYYCMYYVPTQAEWPILWLFNDAFSTAEVFHRV